MREVQARLGEDIQLGRRGENLAVCVTFDVSDWPGATSGTVQLIHQRNGDDHPYPCAITVEGGVATWVVTEADVDVAGRGRMELQYLKGETCIKSATYTTNTLRALGRAGEVPPASEEGWVRKVLKAGGSALASAEAAQKSEVNAKQSEDVVKASASSAASSANIASASAANAKASETAAKSAAASAASSANTASASEVKAKASEASAVRQAEMAKQRAEQAEGWAADARSYAEGATVPAVAGVYNVVIQDRKTGKRYALQVEYGTLILLEIAANLEATEPVSIDTATGAAYYIAVEDGVIVLDPVEES